MQITKTFTVTEDMIDLFNHMNYKRYIDVLEEERANWFKAINLPFDKMRAQGFAVVILKLDFEYIKEARVGDHLVVQTEAGDLGTKSFTLKQTIWNENDEITTKSTCKFVMFDLDKRKSRIVVDQIAKTFSITTKA